MINIITLFKNLFSKKPEPVVASPQPVIKPIAVVPTPAPIKSNIPKDFLLSLGVSAFHSNLYEKYIVQMLNTYDINTPLRLAHFFAQVLHESGNLRYTQELADGSAYEGRKDLGNDQPGDGKKFLGRGAVQVTGRTNYSLYTNYCHVNKRYLDKDFVAHPELLKEPEWACDSAGYFWATKKDKNGANLNNFADEDNFLRTVYFVNGGANGLTDRFDKLLTAYKVFNVDYIPNRAKLIVTKIKEAAESNNPNLGRMDMAIKKAIAQSGINQLYLMMARNGIQ